MRPTKVRTKLYRALRLCFFHLGTVDSDFPSAAAPVGTNNEVYADIKGLQLVLDCGCSLERILQRASTSSSWFKITERLWKGTLLCMGTS